MKLTRTVRVLVSAMLIQALTLNPLLATPAQAWYPESDRYDKVCKPVLAASEEQMRADPTLGGTQASAACTNAKNGRTMYDLEAAKTIIFSLVAITFLVLAILDSLGKFVGADINSVCMGISTVLGILTMGLDMGFAKSVATNADHWVNSVKPIGSSIQSFGGMIVGLFGEGAKKALDKAGCWVAFGLSTMNAVLSGFGMQAASQGIKKNLDVAESIRNNVSATSIAGGFTPPKVNQEQAGMQQTAGIQGSSECSSVPGDAYLSCINETVQDPTLSAMISDKGIMNGFKKMLGKPVGDFVKEYRGDGSPASVGPYVANGIGFKELGGTLTSALEKAKEDLAKNPEYASKYASKAAPKGAKKDAMADFNSMLKNMMGQINPQPQKQKSDPKALVFRRLEAMSDERILESKDISLFDRITNRYQKKSSDPEANAEAPSQK